MQKVFILGNPRSGTSLLRIMLNSHREIASPPESGFMHWWYSKYKHWNTEDVSDPEKVKEFVNDVLSSKKIETWALDRQEIIAQIGQLEPSTYSELVILVYLVWARSNGKTPSTVIDKNNYYIHHLEDLIRIWPDARFLFVIRDGRDVACSYKELKNLQSLSPYRPALPTEIEEIAREWLVNNTRIWDFLNVLSHDRWIMIRYESLIRCSEEQLRRITSFLNISYLPEMLEYYMKNDEPVSTLDWKRKTLEKPDCENIGKYKTHLSQQEIEIFNTVAHEMLERGEYE